MPDTFDCPKCGATYTREKRRVGKPVVCVCGHKFLVPPPETATSYPAIAFDSPPQPRANPPATMRSPGGPPSDFSGAAVPLARSVHSAHLAPLGRWAEPVDPQEAEPLMEAEIVYSGSDYSLTPLPAGDLFGDYGGHGDPRAGSLLTPLPTSSRPSVPPPRDARPKRSTKRPPLPVGVIVLAFLDFLGALVILGVGLLVGGILAMAGGPAALGVLVVLFFASLFIAIGVAMLMGAKWAWWLSAFGHAWSICNGIGAILMSLIFANHLVAGAGVYLFIKCIVRTFFSSLILAYLLQENVLAFFRLKRLDTGQAFGILFGLAITVTLLLNGIAYLILRARFGV